MSVTLSNRFYTAAVDVFDRLCYHSCKSIIVLDFSIALVLIHVKDWVVILQILGGLGFSLRLGLLRLRLGLVRSTLPGAW